MKEDLNMEGKARCAETILELASGRKRGTHGAFRVNINERKRDFEAEKLSGNMRRKYC